ncbi:hypothetical protein TrCOL_g1488, partial [Triparma columacea]
MYDLLKYKTSLQQKAKDMLEKSDSAHLNFTTTSRVKIRRSKTRKDRSKKRLRYLRKKRAALRAALRAAFKEVDRNNTGSIGNRGLKRLLESLGDGDKLTDDGIIAVLGEAPDRITFNEFKALYEQRKKEEARGKQNEDDGSEVNPTPSGGGTEKVTKNEVTFTSEHVFSRKDKKPLSLLPGCTLDPHHVGIEGFRNMFEFRRKILKEEVFNNMTVAKAEKLSDEEKLKFRREFFSSKYTTGKSSKIRKLLDDKQFDLNFKTDGVWMSLQFGTKREGGGGGGRVKGGHKAEKIDMDSENKPKKPGEHDVVIGIDPGKNDMATAAVMPTRLGGKMEVVQLSTRQHIHESKRYYHQGKSRRELQGYDTGSFEKEKNEKEKEGEKEGGEKKEKNEKEKEGEKEGGGENKKAKKKEGRGKNKNEKKEEGAKLFEMMQKNPGSRSYTHEGVLEYTKYL